MSSNESVTSSLLEGLRNDIGGAHVSTRTADLDAYSRDLWPKYLIETVAGDAFPAPPDVVVWPAGVEEVAKIVRRCAEAKAPIVPFGAGSGVCGGTLANHGGVMVDLKRLKAIRHVDRDPDHGGGTVEVEAGILGEILERTLERDGLTLGHFPSSILCSTVGGWLATRSAGQCSSRYGKIEDMVVDLEVVTGDGQIRRTPAVGRAGAGPDWNQIFVGSEGTLGIITAATLTLHPQPTSRIFHGYRAPTVAAGLQIMRRVMQSGLRPAVLRLYDPLDTFLAGTHAETPPSGSLARLKGAIADRIGPRSLPDSLRAHVVRRALSTPTLLNTVSRLPKAARLITVAEGCEAEAVATDAAIAAVARDAGAIDLGEKPGRDWFEHRYDVSFGQSDIYKSGGFVDTFEIATTWSKLDGLYEDFRRALSDYVTVMAHFSHAYPGGCSIYFTFAGSGNNPAEMRERYAAAWRTGLDFVLARGAAIAHHHGVGLSRLQHMAQAHGDAQRWYDALKQVLDPAGVLNPGKVFEGTGGQR